MNQCRIYHNKEESINILIVPAKITGHYGFSVPCAHAQVKLLTSGPRGKGRYWNVCVYLF